MTDETVNAPAPVTAVTDDDINALIAGYNKPLETIEETPGPVSQPEETLSQAAIAAPVSPGDPAAPFGRYMTGKKAGQPKPAPKGKILPPPVTELTPKETTSISGMLIDGALVIMLFDLILPVAISVMNNQFSETKITPDDLKLTSDQKKELKPIIDKVMQNLNFTGNPVAILIIGLMGCYIMNYMLAKMK